MRSSRCFGMTRCGVLRPAAPHVLPQHRRIAVASLKGRQHACEAATRGQTSRCSATASDSSSDATCEANAEDQQRIAAVASVVLRWAAHSLNETLQDYLEQLKEVQGDSQRGFVFRYVMKLRSDNELLGCALLVLTLHRFDCTSACVCVADRSQHCIKH